MRKKPPGLSSAEKPMGAGKISGKKGRAVAGVGWAGLKKSSARRHISLMCFCLFFCKQPQVRHQEKTVTKSRSVCKNKILVVHSRIKKKARFEEHATKSSFEVRELTWFYLDSPKTYKLEHTAPSMAKCVHLAGPRNLVVYGTIQP